MEHEPKVMLAQVGSWIGGLGTVISYGHTLLMILGILAALAGSIYTIMVKREQLKLHRMKVAAETCREHRRHGLPPVECPYPKGKRPANCVMSEELTEKRGTEK